MHRIFAKKIFEKSCQYIFKQFHQFGSFFFDSLLKNEKLMELFLHKLYTNSTFVQRMLDDDRVPFLVKQQSELLTTLLDSKDARDAIFENLKLSSSLLRDHRLRVAVQENIELLNQLVKSDNLYEVIIRNKELLSSLGMDNRLRNTQLADEDLLAEFALDSRIQTAFGQTPKALSKLLSQPEIQEAVIANGRLLQSILSTDKARNTLLAQEELVEPLLRDSRLLKALQQNESLLSQLTQVEELLPAILNNGKLVKQLAGEHKLRNTQLADEAMLNSFTLDSRCIENLLSSDNALIKLAHFLSKRKYNNTFKGLILKVMQLNSADFSESFNSDFVNIFARLDDFYCQYQLFSEYLKSPENAQFRLEKAVLKILNGSHDLLNLMKIVFEENNSVNLLGHQFRIIEWRGFWITFNEIFVNQDYYFKSDRLTPVCIDAGANLGLATIFIKLHYPAALVYCFEPSKKIRELLEKNVEHLDDVQIYPYALSSYEGKSTFKIPVEDSLGGSIERHNETVGSYINESIECRRLSKFISSSVDFLKLDIEGMESEVLEEIGSLIRQVKYLFVEYHGHETELARDFNKIISTLVEHEFRFHVTKALGTEKYTKDKPLSHLEGRFSLAIYGKRI